MPFSSIEASWFVFHLPNTYWNNVKKKNLRFPEEYDKADADFVNWGEFWMNVQLTMLVTGFSDTNIANRSAELVEVEPVHRSLYKMRASCD